jgi:DNA-directed RNA polymerase specialized sigma24 family protein
VQLEAIPITPEEHRHSAREALALLPEPYRHILEQSFLNGRTEAEIALLDRLSQRTIRRHKQIGLAQLRSLIAC